VKLVNTGPNPIYCALGASVPVVLLADPILPTGWATYEAGPAVPITCIAATASQLTTAATIVSELAQ
jgi:ammonia channel protein AmtB